MGFGQPYVPTRHSSPRAALLATPAEAADGCPWTGACSSAGTHMGMSGRTRGDGPSQGCAGPGCCPNMVLHFVSPPEFCRLHCGWEEAEEWAAPQIVSVLAASWDGHEGSGCPPTPVPCSPMGGPGWVESSSLPWSRYLPSWRPVVVWWGVFFFPWDVGKWVQLSYKQRYRGPGEGSTFPGT